MKFLHTFTKGGLLAACFLLLGNLALAQRTVKGKVTDAETGEGLIGATVTVVGTTRGAVTDIDGNYSVEVPSGATQLRFAYTGYEEMVIALGASNAVDAAMKGGTVLDEVVVVGYGTLKAKEVTSAVVTLKNEDFNKGNISSTAQLIQGKVAGVSIIRPGSDPNGEFAIRLRGLSSLSSGVAPLIVVDGIPGVDLNLIDPNDVEAIDILKDGSAAAIYGTRAATGVVIITTKKGSAGRTTANYNAMAAWDQVANRYDVLSADEFIAAGGTDLSPNENVDTDWFDEVTQQGTSMIHNFNLAGGLAKGSYRASFNVRDVNGILRNTGFTRYNGGLSFNQKTLNDRLTLSGNFALTAGEREFGFLEAFRYAIVNNPTAAVKSSEAEYVPYGGYVEKGLFDYFNPVAMIEQNTSQGKGNQMYGSLKADFEVVPNLVASVLVGQERFSFQGNEFYSKQSKFRGRDRNGLGRHSTFNGRNNTMEMTGSYTINFGNSSKVGLLGGYSYQQFDRDGLFMEAGNIISNEFTNNNFGSFLDLSRGLASVGSFKNREKLIAFFGRANLNIDDTYFLTAGLRREGSTRFGPDNKWGIFPFVSGGLNIAKLIDIDKVDALKLRVGYGVTGNRPNEGNLYRLTFASGQRFYYNGNYVPSYAPTYNANPALKWEEKGEINVGLDFNLFGYKIGGTLDYYNRLTEDLIIALTVPVPPNLTGTTYDNVASLRASGFEAAINFTNVVDKENFKWSPSLVFDTYKVSLEDFNESGDTIAFANVGAPGQNGNYYTILYNGAPLGQIWGPVRTGINADGSLSYQDIDGDKQININNFNKDQTLIGDGVPDFSLGLNNTFVIGNFDVNIFLRGVFGHDLANEYRVFYENLDPTASTWNKVKTEYYDPSLKASNRFDNTHVENASFLRLDNMVVGYTFKLPSGSWFNNIRAYAGGQNLFTFTNYSGVDPEPRAGDPGSVDNGGRQGTGLNPLAPGIDRRSTYFFARTFSLGASFGF